LQQVKHKAGGAPCIASLVFDVSMQRQPTNTLGDFAHSRQARSLTKMANPLPQFFRFWVLYKRAKRTLISGSKVEKITESLFPLYESLMRLIAHKSQAEPDLP